MRSRPEMVRVGGGGGGGEGVWGGKGEGRGMWEGTLLETRRVGVCSRGDRCVRT